MMHDGTANVFLTTVKDESDESDATEVRAGVHVRKVESLSISSTKPHDCTYSCFY